MLDKNISVSEQVANLSDRAKLTFTWAIPHADDVGVLPFSARTLKALIAPMWDCTADEFESYVKEIVAQGLWREIAHKGERFYALIKFKDHQTLKKDRQPSTRLDVEHDKNPKKSWEALEAIMESFGIHLEDTGFQMDTEEKGREGKRSKNTTARASTSADLMQSFDAFWDEYPNKVSKKKALAIWQKLAPDAALVQAIMDGLARAKKSAQWTKDGGQFIPHPTTWLNGEKWNDVVRDAASSPAQKTHKL